MQEILKRIYRIIIPEQIRYGLSFIRTWKYYRILMMNSDLSKANEYRLELEYLNKVKHFEAFPYDFREKYIKLKVVVFRDENNHLPYVIHKGKKLFFPKQYDDYIVKYAYKSLLIEQDDKSPHRYFTNDFDVEGVFFDIGSAEGIISLDNIDIVDKVYLLEYDEKWVEALKATFEPWVSKVKIIRKFASDKNDDINITIDKILYDDQIDTNKKITIKIDVEGAEREVLKGLKETLKRESIKLAVCTYHRKDDEAILRQILCKENYQVNSTDGYMLWPYSKDFEFPFFRRGLLRASKSNCGE